MSATIANDEMHLSNVTYGRPEIYNLTADEVNYLLKLERTLHALMCFGVHNFEHYDEAMAWANNEEE